MRPASSLFKAAQDVPQPARGGPDVFPGENRRDDGEAVDARPAEKRGGAQIDAADGDDGNGHGRADFLPREE